VSELFPLQELPRLQVPRAFLETTVDNIKQYVHGQAVELVFALGEVGCSDWEDRCEKTLVVPAIFKKRVIHHKVKRSIKHLTALVCVAAARDLLPPYLVISQELDQALYSSGLVTGNI
jgi:hypothetical protein